MFNKHSKYPIGLDISDLSLKMVQLKKNHDKIFIQSFGKKQLASGIISDGSILDKEKLVHEISDLISRPLFGTVSSNKIIASLPETKTFLKLLEIEKTANALSAIIGSEIEKHVPFTSEELYFDWQIMEKRADSELVLVGAAPKNLIDQYLEVFKMIDLPVLGLEIESVAISRSILKEESPKNNHQAHNYAIIDIGASHTTMIIYAHNTIVTTISMPISGTGITAKIADTLKIKPDQAEKAKLICGFDKTIAQGIITDILEDTIKKLTSKIISALNFYNDHYSDFGNIDKIYLSGGGSNIKNLDKILTTNLKIKTEIGNVFTNIDENQATYKEHLTERHSIDPNIVKNPKKQKLNTKQDSAPSYATAIGLALKHVLTN